MKRWRAHFILLASGLFVILLFALLLNLVVNPLRITPSPLTSSALDPYREIAGRMRTGKAGILRSQSGWRVLFAGSSRIGHAFNPRDPGWHGKRVANLGLSGGFLYETNAMLRYALEENLPECVIIGIDPTDLTSDYDSRDSTDFAMSPLAGDGDAANRELRYLFGISMAEQSLKVLRRFASGEKARYSPEGFRIHADDDADEDNQLAFIRRHLQEETAPYLWSSPVRKEKERLLENLVKDMKSRGIRVVLLYLPLHAVVYAHSSDEGADIIPFESERRLLCGLAARTGAEYWDFNDYHPVHCEPLPADASARMAHWNDLGHFTPQVGHRMVARIMNWPADDRAEYGTQVTHENLSSHLAAVGRGYQRYLRQSGERDVKMKEELQEPVR